MGELMKSIIFLALLCLPIFAFGQSVNDEILIQESVAGAKFSYSQNEIVKATSQNLSLLQSLVNSGRARVLVAASGGGGYLGVGSGKAYTTIQSAYTAASAGQTIHVFNGAYTGQLVIKKNVNFIFDPGVSLTLSHSAKYVVTDSGSNITNYWTGMLNIVNDSLPFNKAQFSNDTSRIFVGGERLHWIYRPAISQTNDTVALTALVYENTFGGTLTWSRDDVGEYRLTGNFPTRTVVTPFSNSGPENVSMQIVDDAQATFGGYILKPNNSTTMLLWVFDTNGAGIEFYTTGLSSLNLPPIIVYP